VENPGGTWHPVVGLRVLEKCKESVHRFQTSAREVSYLSETVCGVHEVWNKAPVCIKCPECKESSHKVCEAYLIVHQE
jgi:hypothetical protein